MVGVNAGNTGAINSNFFGVSAGQNATGASNSNFLGQNAGSSATSASNSNFLGQNAGSSATSANYSNFIGYLAGNAATNASYSNFFGYFAGGTANSSYAAINASYSNFIGYAAGGYPGYGGPTATNASYSNFIGYQAGGSATNAKNSIFIGYNAGYLDSVNNTGNGGFSILIGDYTNTSGFSNSIAIGRGTANSTSGQLNLGNVIFANGINTGTSSSSTAITIAKVGIGTNIPNYNLEVNGSGNFTSGLFVSGVSVSTGINTGNFVTTGQTGSFVTTSQTGNANTLGGQSGSYYLNLANHTGSLAGTGSFITTGQTGSFVTTSQTGVFVTTGQTGSFVTTGQTGAFITSGQTGIFITTGQTGLFALSSQVVYTTGNQTISGTKTFTGIISVLSGNFTSSLTISGVPVSTGTSSSATISNVVYTTGNTTQTISGSLTVTGHFSANTKSFLIDHPIQSGKKLQYGVLEGPEHSVYLRGKTSSSFIQFPNYWSALVDINSVTVSLTPIAEYQKLFVQEINISGVKVGKNYFSDINYYYHIFAERKDVPKLDVEI